MLNRRELSELYRLHGAVVFRRARKLLGNDADAREIVQDVFLSLFERPEQFAGGSAFTTFVYSATTNACLTKLRNQRGRARLRAQREELLPKPPDQLSPEQLLLLQSTLRHLPPELAHVAVYHFMDGLTHDEIAEIMGCSRRHVGNQLERMRELTAALEGS